MPAKPATDYRQPATGNRQLATGNWQLAIGNRQIGGNGTVNRVSADFTIGGGTVTIAAPGVDAAIALTGRGAINGEGGDPGAVLAQRGTLAVDGVRAGAGWPGADAGATLADDGAGRQASADVGRADRAAGGTIVTFRQGQARPGTARNERASHGATGLAFLLPNAPHNGAMIAVTPRADRQTDGHGRRRRGGGPTANPSLRRRPG
jgi:hypothetical protein